MPKQAPECPTCGKKMKEVGTDSGVYVCTNKNCGEQCVCLPKSIFTVH